MLQSMGRKELDTTKVNRTKYSSHQLRVAIKQLKCRWSKLRYTVSGKCPLDFRDKIRVHASYLNGFFY